MLSPDFLPLSLLFLLFLTRGYLQMEAIGQPLGLDHPADRYTGSQMAKTLPSGKFRGPSPCICIKAN